jgi:glycosyltransferase involved in cell wall biosynthesis
MQYKILFISSWFPNKIEPTNGNFVQRHAEAVSFKNEVEILHCIGDSSQKNTYIFDDKIINGIRTLVVYYQNTKNPLLNFSRRMTAYKKGFAKKKTPDLVHANVMQKSLLFAVYLKMKYKIPFVITEHWSGFLNINWSKLSKVQLFISKIIAKNASYILPVSQYLLSDLKNLGCKTKMKVVENVVDTHLFKIKSETPEIFTFLHISNLIPLKNPEKILKTAFKLREKYSNFRLHIGGDGDVENLNKIIRNNKAESFIKTFPMLTLKEVSDKMRNSDCFILFSDYENFPCVLLESLSTGTPAIATKVGGIPEIINKKNGILISNSEAELYDAMELVLQKKVNFDNPKILHDFVENHFSMEKIAEKFTNIYKEILR